MEHPTSASRGRPARTNRPRTGTALWLAATALGLLTTASGQNAPADSIVVDGKMWSAEASAGPLPWAEAEAWCETLESAGHRDWRLPSLLELEALHDPATESGLPAPLALDDCCAWSSQNLAELTADRKGELPNPSGPPDQYYWGFLFSDAVSYYSNGRFPDGSALCVRDPQ